MIVSRLFPELDRLPTEKARRKAFSTAMFEVTTRWRYWALVAGIVAVSVYTQFSVARLGVSMAWRGIVRWAIVAGTVLACWGLILSFKRTIRRTLWRALADSGVPCCQSCGYDLRGIAHGRCPECGKPVEAAGP